MHKLVEQLYGSYFKNNGLYETKGNFDISNIGYSLTLDKDLGNGYYWLFPVSDRFIIINYKMVFTCDYSSRNISPCCLGLGLCNSSNPKEWFGVKELDKKLYSYISQGNEVEVNIRTGDYIDCIGLALTPEYYEDCLKPVIHQSYECFSNTFATLNDINDIPELLPILNSLKTLSFNSRHIDLLLESKLMEILGTILTYQEQMEDLNICQTQKQSDYHQLSLIKTYLCHHYNNNIRLEDLTQMACMSKSKLLKLFKDYTGITISSYIRQLRINNAKKLLLTSTMSLGEIAASVGYQRQSSFSEVFKSCERYYS